MLEAPATVEAAAEFEEFSDPVPTAAAAEKVLIGFIVLAATVCVGLITAYVVLLDGRA